MNIKLIIIIAFSYFYGFLEIFMSMRQKRRRKVVEYGDKWSIWILVISIAIGFSLSFGIAASKTGRIYSWNTLFVIGSFLVIIGMIIRIASILTLKKQFTYTVTKVENHELIETGLYKYIRHPGYLGQLIIFLGIATSLSNWLSVLLMMASVFIGFVNRIMVEEKFMIQQFGKKYIDYQMRTKRLIPTIF